MMKHPTEGDSTVVEVFESSVTVLFEPMQSFYTFYRLVDPNDIKRFGPVSPEPDNIRHAGPSGDRGDYRSDEVQGTFVRLRCSESEVASAPDALLRAELRFFARWV